MVESFDAQRTTPVAGFDRTGTEERPWRCSGLVQLKGGRGGVRLVIDPATPTAALGDEIAAALRPAAQFLGDARIAVELDRPLDGPTAAAITGAIGQFPGLSLMGIGPPRPAAAQARHRPEPRVVRGTLRSGQEMLHDGDIVVLGDVNMGGRVVAAGDVIVLGALRGLAWAGAEGDEDAIIFAQQLLPTQVRIAGAIAQGAGSEAASGPEYAHLEAGRIVVDPWPPAARGGRRAPARH